MKAFQIIAICVAVIFVLGLGALMVIGIVSPETYIYEADEIPEKYVDRVRELGLLEDGEQIQMFYSDGLFKIEEGLYFLTDRKLALYAEEWDDPRLIVPYNDVARFQVEYDDSFLNDSYITLETYEQGEVSFPISSERGRDKKFVELLEQHTGVQSDQ